MGLCLNQMENVKPGCRPGFCVWILEKKKIAFSCDFLMVELKGLEPSTSSMPWMRSPG